MASSRPAKTIVTLATALFAPVYLVVLSFYYIPKGLRPSQQWSLRTAIGNELLRIFYRYATWVRMPPRTVAKPESLKSRYIVVQPGPSSLYDDLPRNDGANPAPVSAIWFPEAYNADHHKDWKVVLHFQGGAFVTALKPDTTGAFPSKLFQQKMGGITLYAQYRVSRDEETRFPAALQDLITFYYYLLSSGVDANRILISGDSAGGNLVLALLRYIEVTSSKNLLPTPLGAMLWSPWVDVSKDAIRRYKKSGSLRTDFLNAAFLQWGVDSYTLAGDQGRPYISPLTHPFASKTPIFVQAGTAELLYEEIRQFVEEMRSMSGNKVKFVETDGAPHCIILCGFLIGFKEQTISAVREASDFFEK